MSRELQVHVFGPEQAKPCLWVHGWLGRGLEGMRLQELLGDEVKLVCPDLPGHGDTALGDWHQDELLKALAYHAGQCEAAIGYSLGGRLLMMAAARTPCAFGRMVIESSHPGLQSIEDMLQRKHLDLERAASLRAQGLDAFCETWYQAEMWAGILPPERTGNAEELAEALKRFGLWRQPDVRPWIRTFRNPLLWLAGSQDRAYGAFAEWCATSTHHQVELLDAGHNVHLQQPAHWGASVHAFLTS